MSTPNTVAFHTLGCKLNFSETSSIRRRFEEYGYHTVPWEDAADIYVLNTCSVTESADRKCRAAVRKALRQKNDARIVVIGCYAQLKPDDIASIPGVDLVLGAAEKFNILDYIDGLSKSADKGMVKAGEISEVNSFQEAFSFGDRTRAFLKIQDGCDYKCSFCTIPLARGRSRSISIKEVCRQAAQISANGVQEIVLTGVNIGDFGLHIDKNNHRQRHENFLQLITALDKIEGIQRFRISSIEPNLCSDEIIDFVASSRRFVPHFHMPLQSGSNVILKRMRRRYRRELYSQRVEQIKNIMPDCCLGADVIVGFPGETDEEFLNSKAFISDLDLSYLHVFTYSERDNTPAKSMEHSVPVNVRRKRSDMLRKLSVEKRKEFYRQYIGQSRPVLIESRDREGFLHGFTDNYIRVRVRDNEGEIPIPVNSILNVTLTGQSSNEALTGIPFYDRSHQIRNEVLPSGKEY